MDDPSLMSLFAAWLPSHVTAEGRIVEHDADKPCCDSCRDEEDDFGREFADRCCCTHGELYGWREDDGSILWAYDDAPKEWERQHGEPQVLGRSEP